MKRPFIATFLLTVMITHGALDLGAVTLFNASPIDMQIDGKPCCTAMYVMQCEHHKPPAAQAAKNDHCSKTKTTSETPWESVGASTSANHACCDSASHSSASSSDCHGAAPKSSGARDAGSSFAPVCSCPAHGAPLITVLASFGYQFLEPQIATVPPCDIFADAPQCATLPICEFSSPPISPPPESITC